MENQETLTKTCDIVLEDGTVLTLEYNESFSNAVRRFYSLGLHDEPSPEQLKGFFTASVAGIKQ